MELVRHKLLRFRGTLALLPRAGAEKELSNLTRWDRSTERAQGVSVPSSHFKDMTTYDADECNEEHFHSALMVESCVIWMLLAPVVFSTSTPMIYMWSDEPLGRMEVVTFSIGLTSYLRVTLVQWNGALSDYSSIELSRREPNM